MERYRFLEHTADAKFEAFGRTLGEAFGHAALALTELITDPAVVAPRVNRTIHVEAEDAQALLYDWLEKFLILLDAEHFILHDVPRIEVREEGPQGGWRLDAEVRGDIGMDRYEFRTHVKAITYAEMQIGRTSEGLWSVTVVADL